jgi:large subunit ribosomal protein L25
MEKVVIQAARREITGKQVNALRREGKLPAVMYGHNFNATPIMLDRHGASQTLHGLTTSSLVTIDLEGEEHLALVAEKQRDYIRGDLLHVDFLVVSLKEKVRAQVAIELVGVAPVVKDFNATVVSNMDSLEVECLPQDLPEKFVIDLSTLTNIGDSVLVKDVVSSDQIEVMEDPDAVIIVAVAAEIEVEEEEEEVEEELEEGVEPEVVEKGKKEEPEEE